MSIRVKIIWFYSLSHTHTHTLEIRNILNVIINASYFLLLQGLPSCPVSLDVLRSHLPYLGYCLNFSDDKNEAHTDDDNTTNNNNNLYGNQKDQFAPNLTPLHRFYREQQQRKKMPGFRGRRGLCGCLQVSYIRLYVYSSMSKYAATPFLSVTNRQTKYNWSIMTRSWFII